MGAGDQPLLPPTLHPHHQEERNLLQKDIAELLNITASAYGYYEQGKRIPDSDTINLLSDYFNVSLDYLMGKTNIRQSADNIINSNSTEYTVALHSDTDYDELPKEAKDEINNFIEFIKQKYKK